MQKCEKLVVTIWILMAFLSGSWISSQTGASLQEAIYFFIILASGTQFWTSFWIDRATARQAIWFANVTFAAGMLYAHYGTQLSSLQPLR